MSASHALSKGKTLLEWLRSGEYLPAPLRDFHDQKDVFKTLWRRVNQAKAKDPSLNTYLGQMTWTSAQIFAIDHFLWFMAVHGWTLQRSRARVTDGFDDLAAMVKQRRDEEAALLRQAMNATPTLQTNGGTDG